MNVLQYLQHWSQWLYSDSPRQAILASRLNSSFFNDRIGLLGWMLISHNPPHVQMTCIPLSLLFCIMDGDGSPSHICIWIQDACTTSYLFQHHTSSLLMPSPTKAWRTYEEIPGWWARSWLLNHWLMPSASKNTCYKSPQKHLKRQYYNWKLVYQKYVETMEAFVGPTVPMVTTPTVTTPTTGNVYQVPTGELTHLVQLPLVARGHPQTPVTV